MAFSGGVKLGDLDDFLAPSQECVKPLIQAADGGGAKLNSADPLVPKAPEVQRPNLIKSKKGVNNTRAEVTLSDCLACSGCVTSAETVLLQQHSGEELRRRAAEAPLTVVSVSAQCIASLALHCGTSQLLTLQRLASLLSRIGANYVLEASAAEAVALLEAKAEFVRRFRKGGTSLPLLSSHCPGWTCYAEKVVDPSVLPHLSPFRPPQQVQGRFVKTILLETHNRRRFHRWWRAQSPLFAPVWPREMTPMPPPLAPSDVYHVAVQPCFDRKIEAARPQFEAEAGVREVDTVLTTTEVLELLRSAAGELVPEASAAAEAADVLAALPACVLGGEVLTDLLLGDLRERPAPLLCGVATSAGSGGFLEHVFTEAARELFQREAPLEFHTKQNEDMREVLLREAGTDKPLLRFVAAYGFRNIQNVLRRVARSDCGHFVEVMACPGGCLNGGGQVPSPSPGRSHLQQLEAMLTGGEGVAFVPPKEHPLVLPLYRYIAGGEGALDRLVGSESVRSWLSAEWRSLKVDDEGKPVMGSAALKW